MLWLAGCGILGNTEPEQDWPEPSPALWEAVHEDGNRLYLFGTIHSLPDGADWRTPQLDRALAASDVLLVEIAELGASGLGQAAFEARAYSQGLDPILERVPQDDRSTLALALDLADIDPDRFDRTENWAAALQLGATKRCFSSQNGVDRALLGEFVEVRSFESHADQFAIFDNLPEDSQVDLLLAIASERGCEESAARVEAWLTGDMGTLHRSMIDGFRGNAELEAALVHQRNAIYAYDIEQLRLAEPGTVLFVAVGAGHMVGVGGLPELLLREGYTVTRIQ